MHHFPISALHNTLLASRVDGAVALPRSIVAGLALDTRRVGSNLDILPPRPPLPLGIYAMSSLGDHVDLSWWLACVSPVTHAVGAGAAGSRARLQRHRLGRALAGWLHEAGGG